MTVLDQPPTLGRLMESVERIQGGTTQSGTAGTSSDGQIQLCALILRWETPAIECG